MAPINDEWFEGAQRVRRRGMVIVTTKRASLRLAYGDERVRLMREERMRLGADNDSPLRRFLSKLASKPSDTRLSLEPAPACVPDPQPARRENRPVEAIAKPRAETDCPHRGKIGDCWKRLLEQRHKLGEDHPLTAITIHKLACLCRDAERHDEAARWFERAHTVWSDRLGPDHPSVARNLREWAVLMRNQGFDAEASRLESRAAAIHRQARAS